jgi:prepilin-type N-terminal cleavage/methylation domain-containing protein
LFVQIFVQKPRNKHMDLTSLTTPMRDSMSLRTANSFQQPGFTLAELLIALSILGVIASFAIPKILSSQQNGQFKSAGKETASMVAQPYIFIAWKIP